MFSFLLVLIFIHAVCESYGVPDSEIENFVERHTKSILNMMSHRGDWCEILLEKVRIERENRLRLACLPYQEECLNTVKNIRRFLSPWPTLLRHKRQIKENVKTDYLWNQTDQTVKKVEDIAVTKITPNETSTRVIMNSTTKMSSTTPPLTTTMKANSMVTGSSTESRASVQPTSSVNATTLDYAATQVEGSNSSTISVKKVADDNNHCNGNKFEDCKHKNYCFNNQPCTYVCILKEHVCLCRKGFTGKRCDMYDLKTLIDLAKNPETRQPIKLENLSEATISVVSATVRYTLPSTDGISNSNLPGI